MRLPSGLTVRYQSATAEVTKSLPQAPLSERPTGSVRGRRAHAAKGSATGDVRGADQVCGRVKRTRVGGDHGRAGHPSGPAGPRSAHCRATAAPSDGAHYFCSTLHVRHRTPSGLLPVNPWATAARASATGGAAAGRAAGPVAPASLARTSPPTVRPGSIHAVACRATRSIPRASPHCPRRAPRPALRVQRHARLAAVLQPRGAPRSLRRRNMGTSVKPLTEHVAHADDLPPLRAQPDPAAAPKSAGLAAPGPPGRRHGRPRRHPRSGPFLRAVRGRWPPPLPLRTGHAGQDPALRLRHRHVLVAHDGPQAGRRRGLPGPRSRQLPPAPHLGRIPSSPPG